VWTGEELILWGGYLDPAGPTIATLTDPGIYTNAGARYHLSTDSWTAIPLDAGTPDRGSPQICELAGGRLVVWGTNYQGYNHERQRGGVITLE
jgi:hypothetical protein